ncbi:MAG: hypothetical protein AAF628_20280 [Planctomycetota bacterium]
MSLLTRALLYAACLFLVLIVYSGQRHSTAGAILRAASWSTLRLFLWSVAAVAGMLLLEYLFID